MALACWHTLEIRGCPAQPHGTLGWGPKVAAVDFLRRVTCSEYEHGVLYKRRRPVEVGLKHDVGVRTRPFGTPGGATRRVSNRARRSYAECYERCSHRTGQKSWTDDR